MHCLICGKPVEVREDLHDIYSIHCCRRYKITREAKILIDNHPERIRLPIRVIDGQRVVTQDMVEQAIRGKG
jgi:hypothetical protein